MWNPPATWYDPPEPTICCYLAEDEEDHDVQACMDVQAEDAAEARAERQREEERDSRYEYELARDWEL